MPSLFTSSLLPLAAATEHALAIAVAPAPTNNAAFSRQTFTARQLAATAAHRAKVLAQRRTAIPTSAKRW